MPFSLLGFEDSDLIKGQESLRFFSLIDANNVHRDFSYDPANDVGIRIYDLDGDMGPDQLLINIRDGESGDLDNLANGQIVGELFGASVLSSPSTLISLASEHGFDALVVQGNTQSYDSNVRLSLDVTGYGRDVTDLYYALIPAHELSESAEQADFSRWLSSYASPLISTLQSLDTVIPQGLRFTSSVFLRSDCSLSLLARRGDTYDVLSIQEQSAGRFVASDSLGLKIGVEKSIQLAGPNDLASSATLDRALIDLRHFTDDTLVSTVGIGREANFDAVIGFYRIASADGSVRLLDGSKLTPNDSGYIEAALSPVNILPQNFSLSDNQTANLEYSWSRSDGLIAPYAIVNDRTRREVLRYVSFEDANPDRLNHFKRLGDNSFGFEDQFGGGDFDYDDFIFAVDFNFL
jgi:hypothetical protein